MIDKIISRGERVLWEGSPNKFLYIIGPIYIYLFAIFWGIFDWRFIKLFLSTTDSGREFGAFPMGFHNFFIIFILIHLSPVWYAIFSPIFRAFIVPRIKYVITDRKVYIVSGFMGTDIISMDLENCNDASVTVSPLEHIFRVGTVRLLRSDLYYSKRSGSRSRKYALRYIKEPYEVYAQINTTNEARNNSNTIFN